MIALIWFKWVQRIQHMVRCYRATLYKVKSGLGFGDIGPFKRMPRVSVISSSTWVQYPLLFMVCTVNMPYLIQLDKDLWRWYLDSYTSALRIAWLSMVCMDGLLLKAGSCECKDSCAKGLSDVGLTLCKAWLTSQGDNELQLSYIASEENAADIFIKAMYQPVF